MGICKWVSVFLIGILSGMKAAQADDALQFLQVRNAYENQAGFLIVDLQVDPSADNFQDSFTIGSKTFSVNDHFFWRLSPGLALHQLHLTQAKELLSEAPGAESVSGTNSTQMIRQFTARYSDFQLNCQERKSNLRVIHSDYLEISSCLSNHVMVLNAVTPERKREIQDQIQNELISLEPYPDFRTPLALLKLPQSQMHFYLDIPAYNHGLPTHSYPLPQQTHVYSGLPHKMMDIPVQSIQRKWGYLQIKFENGNHITRYRQDQNEPFRYYFFEAETYSYTPLEVLPLEERRRLKIDFKEVNPSKIHTPSEVFVSHRTSPQWIHFNFQPGDLLSHMKASFSRHAIRSMDPRGLTIHTHY